MATTADLQALGYAVAESSAGVYFVSGNGLATYIAADDQAQIDSLADQTLHAERLTPVPPPVVAPAPGDVVQQADGSFAIVVVASADGLIDVAPLAASVSTSTALVSFPSA